MLDGQRLYHGLDDLRCCDNFVLFSYISYEVIVVSVNFQLFNEGNVFDASQEKLKNYIGCLTCLKAIIGEKFLMTLILFEQK